MFGIYIISTGEGFGTRGCRHLTRTSPKSQPSQISITASNPNNTAKDRRWHNKQINWNQCKCPGPEDLAGRDLRVGFSISMGNRIWQRLKSRPFRVRPPFAIVVKHVKAIANIWAAFHLLASWISFIFSLVRLIYGFDFAVCWAPVCWAEIALR